MYANNFKIFKIGQRFLEPAVYEQITGTSDGPVRTVVKDYSRYANTRWAFIARFLVKHEHLMLNHLAGISPNGWTVDPYLLTMPFVEGRALRNDEDPCVLQNLHSVVHAMHAKNVVHNDLHASNIIVRPDNTTVILDVATAMYLPFKWPLKMLRDRDLANLAKIKYQKCPQILTADDRKRLKKPLWVRSLQKLWYRIYRPGRLKALRGQA